MEQAFEPIADSKLGAGSTTSPAAGATIAQVVPVAGRYHCRARYAISGTAETLLQNVSIAWNGVSQISTIPSISGSGWNEIDLGQVTLDGTHAFAIKATALATTGAVYSAIVIATEMAAS